MPFETAAGGGRRPGASAARRTRFQPAPTIAPTTSGVNGSVPFSSVTGVPLAFA